LIDRSSQWHDNNLDRYKAIEWLDMAIKQRVPDELSNIIPDLKSMLRPLENEIQNIYNRNDLDRAWFYFDNKV